MEKTDLHEKMLNYKLLHVYQTNSPTFSNEATIRRRVSKSYAQDLFSFMLPLTFRSGKYDIKKGPLTRSRISIIDNGALFLTPPKLRFPPQSIKQLRLIRSPLQRQQQTTVHFAPRVRSQVTVCTPYCKNRAQVPP